jgi:hypothetical protein
MKRASYIPVLILLLSAICVFASKCGAEDLRAYQHGIDILKRENGTYWLIWSSAGNPPKIRDENWTHDIYYSSIDPNHPSVTPTILISNPEAQEPVSAAISRDGRIMITCEDGWNVRQGVGQRWGLYDGNLGPVMPYPRLIKDGGHSGHVAAVGKTFVVLWNDGWDETVPGADGIGVGKRILLDRFSSSGAHLNPSSTQVSEGGRSWWPLVAGSDSRAVLLWQRYVAGDKYSELMYSVYDPRSNTFAKRPGRLATRVKYYVYDVQYYAAIDRFLVVGAYYDGGGFAYLMDDEGNIVARNISLPPMVRESKPARADHGSHSFAAYPRSPDGVFVLKLTRSSIELTETVSDTYDWQSMGTVGIFTGRNSVYFANLSDRGIVEKRFMLTLP